MDNNSEITHDYDYLDNFITPFYISNADYLYLFL